MTITRATPTARRTTRNTITARTTTRATTTSQALARNQLAPAHQFGSHMSFCSVPTGHASGAWMSW